MNSTRRFTSRFSSLLLTCLFAFALSSCVSTEEVKRIVDDSNLATFSADNGLENPAALNTTPQNGWQETSRKIDNYIANHADDSATVAALRIRQAMLLLANNQFNLAGEAFGAAPIGDLVTTRDRALKSVSDSLLIWYRLKSRPVAQSDIQPAIDAMHKIAQTCSTLNKPVDADIRDWLGANVALIGLKLAKEVDVDTPGIGPERLRDFVSFGIDTYTQSIPPGETARWESQKWPPAVQNGEEDITESTATSLALRRRFRANVLIQRAQAAIAENHITGVAITDPFFRSRILGNP